MQANRRFNRPGRGLNEKYAQMSGRKCAKKRIDFSKGACYALIMTNGKTTTLTTPSGLRVRITDDLEDAGNAREDGAIVVYDDRHTGNPSFRIYRSYDIVRKELRREVLEALIAYDAADPTDPPWKRTLPSLEREWLLHNAAYRAGFLRSRAADVDLDNREEGKGWLHFFKRGMRLIFRSVARLFRKKTSKSLG